MNTKMTADQITAYAAQVATPAQLTALAKMSKMGWKVTRVLGKDISLGVKNQAVWLHADGSLTRPTGAAKCAKLAR